jgi:hypothetical protein
LKSDVQRQQQLPAVWLQLPVQYWAKLELPLVLASQKMRINYVIILLIFHKTIGMFRS